MATTYKEDRQHTEDEAAIIERMMKSLPTPIVDSDCYDYEAQQRTFDRRYEHLTVLRF